MTGDRFVQTNISIHAGGHLFHLRHGTRVSRTLRHAFQGCPQIRHASYFVFHVFQLFQATQPRSIAAQGSHHLDIFARLAVTTRHDHPTREGVPSVSEAGRKAKDYHAARNSMSANTGEESHEKFASP
jgi:hypothetical protein